MAIVDAIEWTVALCVVGLGGLLVLVGTVIALLFVASSIAVFL